MNETISLREYMESRLGSIEESITELKNNHIAHVEKKLDRLTWLLVTTLIALIVHGIGVILSSH